MQLELTIQTVVFGGDGLSRFEGYVVFVPFTCPGERVLVEIDEVKRHYARGILLEVQTPHPSRISPRCPVFTQCGGCVYQHVETSVQREWKRAQVQEILKRSAKLDFDVPALMSTELDWAYRNRITLHAGEGRLGFHRHRRPEQLVAVTHCPIASAMVNLELSETLLKKRYKDSGAVTLREPGLPRHFVQTNTGVAELLEAWVREKAGQGKLLVDLFCGAGFFSLSLADQFKSVIGIDRSTFALDTARAIAPEHVQFHEGSCDEWPLPGMPEGRLPEDTVMIVDPPREGLPEALRLGLAASGPGRIIYVSCDPATFSRDLHAMAGAYQLAELQPFDMFPQTAQVELAAALDRMRDRA